VRSRHSRHDFADRDKEDSSCLSTVGQEGQRVFGRPFVTAGWVVIGVSAAVAVVEVALLVLVLRL
jgi:hypothetical protein